MAYKLLPPDCRENAPNRIWNSKNFQGVIPPDLRPGLRKCKGGNPKTARARARTHNTHTHTHTHTTKAIPGNICFRIFDRAFGTVGPQTTRLVVYRRFVQFDSGTNAHCESFPLTVLYNSPYFNCLIGYLVGGVAQWLGRRSLTSGLSLICA